MTGVKSIKHFEEYKADEINRMHPITTTSLSTHIKYVFWYFRKGISMYTFFLGRIVIHLVS